MQISKKIINIFAVLLIILPLFVSAQVLPGGGPVPVPYNPQFSLLGPGGQLTATGLILSIINIALAIAGALAVLFLIVGGFRYITAGGNEEQTESAKKTLTHAVIGIVIIILSFVIIRVISNALILGSFGT